MEIRGIGRIFSAYKTAKTDAPKKTSAPVSAKKTDRVEFGFAAAITAAKAEIANEVNADVTPKEIVDAGKQAGEFSSEELAALILMG